MNAISGGGGPRHPIGKTARPSLDLSKEDQLRQTARTLNSVFVQQLFTAMRSTVDTQDSLTSGGQGEDMFRGMMDQQVAESAPDQWQKHDALTEAIVRQLGRNMK
jgi:flagellar protein FlgJ